MLLYINLSWSMLIGVVKPYSVSRTSSYLSVLKLILKMVAFHILLVFAYYVFQQNYRYSRELLLLLYTSFLVSSTLFHTLLFLVIKWARREGFNYRNIIIVANQSKYEEVSNFFGSQPEYGYHVILVIDPAEIKGSDFKTSIAKVCADNEIHELFYSMSAMDQETLNFIFEFAETNLIKIRLIADFKGIGFNGIELENYDSTAIIKVHATPLDEWDKQLTKRLFDTVFSIIVIVFILSWLLPILAIAIKLSSRGPIIFTQKRTGRDNEAFTCYKLRTMRVNVDSDLIQATKNDSRITPIGKYLRKTSLDELPQFFNVLIGNMSVVGPRPLMLKHTEDYMGEISNFMVRHHIKPGITGLAQSHGYRGEIRDFESINKRIKLDLHYVRNWSFWLDLKIIIRTIIPKKWLLK
jgi:Undecaprenyl-phosphate glucose phosphotransferase